MGMNRMLRVLSLCFVFCLVCSTVYAEGMITDRTGTVRITSPDETISIVYEKEPLPDIPSGSLVELFSGSVKAAPVEGFILLSAEDATAEVSAGDRVALDVDQKTRMADFKVDAGKISIKAVNAMVIVNQGQEAEIKWSELFGASEVHSIKGNLEVFSVGVKIFVPEGAIARIATSSMAMDVHIESKAGIIKALDVNGKTVEISQGKSVAVRGRV